MSNKQDMVPKGRKNPPKKRGRKKSMARRNKRTGRFMKGKARRSPSKKRRRSRRNPAPAPAKRRSSTRNAPRKANGQFARKNWGGGSKRNYSRKNPDLDWMSLGGAAAASAGTQIAVNTFVAPNFPKIAPFAAPVIELALGWFTMQKAKSRTFGIGMFVLGLRDLLATALAYFQAQKTAPAPAPEGALWFRSPTAFPQAAMSNPLVTGTSMQRNPGRVARRVVRGGGGGGYAYGRGMAAQRQTM